MGILSILAAEAAEPSKVPFYILGGALAAWAVALSALGMTRPDFPGDAATSRGVIAISTVLVIGAMFTSVITG